MPVTMVLTSGIPEPEEKWSKSFERPKGIKAINFNKNNSTWIHGKLFQNIFIKKKVRGSQIFFYGTPRTINTRQTGGKHEHYSVFEWWSFLLGSKTAMLHQQATMQRTNTFMDHKQGQEADSDRQGTWGSKGEERVRYFLKSRSMLSSFI